MTDGTDVQRLALGTVQFGLDYGIANKRGRVPVEEVGAILDAARRDGVATLDTAVAYGESETVLGEHDLSTWAVVSKLPPVPTAVEDIRYWVFDQVTRSLERLRIERLRGLLLHSAGQLHSDRGAALAAALRELREVGYVKKIGMSIYDPDELGPLLNILAPDIVQAPLSLLDRRIEQSGWMDRLKAAGIEVHVRSIFLQGLLLMEDGTRPAQFDRWPNVWSAWADWLAEAGLTPLDACLRYALSTGADRIVIGVDGLDQLREILAAARGGFPGALPDWPEPLPPQLINPARWGEL